MHHLIHNKNCPGHISRILHKGDEQKKYYNIGQKHNDPSNTANYSINKKIL